MALLSVSEVAKALHVKPFIVMVFIQDGKIKAFNHRIPESEIERLLAAPAEKVA